MTARVVPTTPPPAYTSNALPALGSFASSSTQASSSSSPYPVRGPEAAGPAPYAVPAYKPRGYGPTPVPPLNGGFVVGPRVNPGISGAIGMGLGVGAASGGYVGPPAQAPLLPVPYYDPASPHSVQLARSRARWRFFEALLWALMIWFTLAVFFGAGSAWDRSVQGGRRRGHEHPHYYAESNGLGNGAHFRNDTGPP